MYVTEELPMSAWSFGAEVGLDVLRCSTAMWFLRNLCWVLNARLIKANKMKSDGDLHGVQCVACSVRWVWLWVWVWVWDLRVVVRRLVMCDASYFAGKRWNREVEMLDIQVKAILDDDIRSMKLIVNLWRCWRAENNKADGAGKAIAAEVRDMLAVMW